MIVFVTEMLRWGEDETHHYIIGTYSTRVQAEFAGRLEEDWRGGKYTFRVVETIIDAPVPQTIWDYRNTGEV